MTEESQLARLRQNKVPRSYRLRGVTPPDWVPEGSDAVDEAQLPTSPGAPQRGRVEGNVLAVIVQLEERGQLPTVTRIAVRLGKSKGEVGKALAKLLAVGKVRKGPKVGREQPYLENDAKQ